MTPVSGRAEGRKIIRVASVRKRENKKSRGGPPKSRASACPSISHLRSHSSGLPMHQKSPMQGPEQQKQNESTPAGFEPAPAERRRWVSMIQFILIFRSRPLSHGALERIHRWIVIACPDTTHINATIKSGLLPKRLVRVLPVVDHCPMAP